MRRVPFAVIRAALLAAREGGTGWRVLGRQVGLSPAGLRHFVNGGVPYDATHRKLLAWYAQYGEASEEQIRAAFELLLERLPPDTRALAEPPLVKALITAYGVQRLPPPPWLEDWCGGGSD